MRVLRDLVPLLLLASWPFVAFLAANKAQIFRLEDVLVPWGAYVVALTAGALLAARWIRGLSLVRVAIVVGALSATFFGFGSLGHLLGLAGIELGTVWLLVWLVAFAAVGGLCWVFSRRPAAWLVTTVVAAAFLVWPSLDLASAWFTGGSRQAGEDKVATTQPGTGKMPNVYWFLLDGYVRDDSLRRYFAHDNGPFVQFLSERGFQIGWASHSNYDNTTFSLASTMGMDYVYLPGEPRPPSRAYTRTLAGFNPVVRKFLATGYRYIHAPYAGSAKTQCGGLEHRCIRARPSGRIPLNEVQVNLLRLTPLFRVIRRLMPGAFRYDHIFIADVMAAMRDGEAAPFFLFAHILSPHAPPRFTPECRRLDDVAASLDVGEGFYDPVQFRTDVRCTNRSLERAVREIVERDSSDPIIILQGDHGFKFRLPGESEGALEAAADGVLAARRLAILNAIRLPTACRDRFYETISPVNTFRLVFACIEGRQPEFVADRHFLRPRGSEGGLKEVHP
ncbi:MAG: hypothetical protein ACE5JZ_00230 [Kiloniellales bacterium]